MSRKPWLALNALVVIGLLVMFPYAFAPSGDEDKSTSANDDERTAIASVAQPYAVARVRPTISSVRLFCAP